MDREPGKRRVKWFTKSHLGGLGQFWQRTLQRGLRSRGGPMGKRSAFGGSAPPPLGEQPWPRWDPVVPGKPNPPDRSLRTLWRRFRPASRRQQVGVAVGAGGLLLLSLIGVSAFCSHMLLTPNNTSNAGGVSGHTASSSTANATASMTATAAAPLTVAFTCASGRIKRTGKVCVHTQANAILTLTVRYCDGTYAGGKGLNGSTSADASGDYTWEFAVHTKCAGTATATVVAKSAGQTVTKSTTFTVTH
jgi:hypothetical protein